jgi:hypothetical protein
MTAILGNNQFEALRQRYPSLNTCAAEKHVPEIEHYIRTVKDRSQSTYQMLLFRHLPRIFLIHLFKNAVFWLNAFPHEDGASQKYSPRYIMTGQQLTFVNFAVIEFGAYAQTHEEHTNDMSQHTMGCIWPTGNRQGAHWFMSLSSGRRMVQYRWTDLCPGKLLTTYCTLVVINTCPPPSHMPIAMVMISLTQSTTLRMLFQTTTHGTDIQQDNKLLMSDSDDSSSYDDGSDRDDDAINFGRGAYQPCQFQGGQCQPWNDDQWVHSEQNDANNRHPDNNDDDGDDSKDPHDGAHDACEPEDASVGEEQSVDNEVAPTNQGVPDDESHDQGV